KVDHATRLLEEGFNMLASMGHPFHLVPGPEPSDADLWDWPKKMFALHCPEGRVCWYEAEVRELGDGWFSSWAEVQRAAGLEAQYLGRGGVTAGTGLPVKISTEESR